MIYKTVPFTESQVGKYIDINGDGIPEGVIFADLAVGGKGKYEIAEYAKYKIPTIKEGLKDYVVIGEYNDKINGKQEILSPILDGLDRFYIMALNDVSLHLHPMYATAYFKLIDNYKTLTSPVFGAGRQNTLTMIEKWNNEEYGEKNRGSSPDLWGEIQTLVNDGWFVSSCAEWSAFGDGLNLTKDNYSDKGLKIWYWTSTLSGYKSAYAISPLLKSIIPYDILNASCIRLARMF